MPTTTTTSLSPGPGLSVPPIYLFWAACGFGLLLILFFMYFMTKREELNRGQWQIARVLGAITAAMTSGLFAGAAAVAAEGKWGPLSLTATGTAGFGIFILVYLVWPSPAPPNNDGISFSVPPNSSFQFVANSIVQTKACVVDFQGFSSAELAIILTPQSVIAKSTVEALSLLRLLAPQNTLPQYTVAKQDSTFVLTRVK